MGTAQVLASAIYSRMNYTPPPPPPFSSLPIEAQLNLIAFAELSIYGDYYPDGDDGTMKPNNHIPPGWELHPIQPEQHGIDGLRITVFRSETGKTVVAFGGTDTGDIGDYSADIAQGFTGRAGNQYRLAVNALNQLREQGVVVDYAVGQSLGAAISEGLNADGKVPYSVAFNSPGGVQFSDGDTSTSVLVMSQLPGDFDWVNGVFGNANTDHQYGTDSAGHYMRPQIQAMKGSAIRHFATNPSLGKGDYNRDGYTDFADRAADAVDRIEGNKYGRSFHPQATVAPVRQGVERAYTPQDLVAMNDVIARSTQVPQRDVGNAGDDLAFDPVPGGPQIPAWAEGLLSPDDIPDPQPDFRRTGPYGALDSIAELMGPAGSFIDSAASLSRVDRDMEVERSRNVAGIDAEKTRGGLEELRSPQRWSLPSILESLADETRPRTTRDIRGASAQQRIDDKVYAPFLRTQRDLPPPGKLGEGYSPLTWDKQQDSYVAAQPPFADPFPRPAEERPGFAAGGAAGASAISAGPSLWSSQRLPQPAAAFGADWLGQDDFPLGMTINPLSRNSAAQRAPGEAVGLAQNPMRPGLDVFKLLSDPAHLRLLASAANLPRLPGAPPPQRGNDTLSRVFQLLASIPPGLDKLPRLSQRPAAASPMSYAERQRSDYWKQLTGQS